MSKPDLNNLTTRELLHYLKMARKFRGFYSPWDGVGGYTSEEIKEVLATREHIPNKAESKAIRQAEAKRKKNR